MFFGSRRRRNAANGVTRPSDPPANDFGSRQSLRWQAWRRAAQKVTRTWNECIAADSRHQPELYQRYIAALEEERLAAAEIERMVNLEATAQDASDRVATGDRRLPNH